MLEKKLTLLVVVITVFGLFLNVLAQEDSPTYVLSKALESNEPNLRGKAIEVLFGKNFPKDTANARTSVACPNTVNPCYIANDGAFAAKNWKIQAFPLNGGSVINETIDQVEVFPNIKLVRITLRGTINTGNFKYIIIYSQANIPTITLGPGSQKTKAEKIFTAAKGKSDADIYFKGSATAARRSGPVYSIEAKFGYLQSLRRMGAIGGTFTLASDEGSDVDPDSITLAGTYEKIFVFGPSTGIIFRSDFIGGEFDKKNKTQNLTTGLDATLVLPSKRLAATTFAAVDFMAGFDAGHNYKHELNPNGLGNFWRPKVGVNAYLLALNTPVFNRISLNSEYKLRLPRSAEPFTEKISGENVTTLTKKPRHYFGTDLNLMFTSAYGVTISHRYGSLPPAFKFVDHKVSIGFTIQLKQANK